VSWPETLAALAREQERLAALSPSPWTPPDRPLRVAACAVVFGRGGRDDEAWAAAVLCEAGDVVASCSRAGRSQARFQAGQLALREGPLLEVVVRGLQATPDVLLVAAAGRDHPRRAGLALQLGTVLDLPTVGVTDEPLAALGAEPGPASASQAALLLGSETVGYRVRTRRGARPVVAHAGWRTTAEVAAEIVLGSSALARWPEPMRAARRLARELRDRSRS
jgi:deoxyribonuclease V